MFWLNTMIFKHHNQKQFICYHFHGSMPRLPFITDWRLHIFSISLIYTFEWYFFRWRSSLTAEVVRAVLSCHILTAIKTHVRCTFLRWPLWLFCCSDRNIRSQHCLGCDVNEWRGKRKAQRFIQCHVWWRKECLPHLSPGEPSHHASQKWFMLM